MSPLACFRVYPGKGTPKQYRHNPKRYFTIRCYQTHKQMTKAKEAMRPMDGPGYSFAAITMPMVTYKYRKGKWRTKDRSIGDALFHKGELGAGLVAHEALHISLCFLRTQHNSYYHLSDECDEKEEELAYTLTSVVRQLWHGFFRHRLY